MSNLELINRRYTKSYLMLALILFLLPFIFYCGGEGEGEGTEEITQLTSETKIEETEQPVESSYIEEIPPVYVYNTIPKDGEENVPADIKEIKIIFSKKIRLSVRGVSILEEGKIPVIGTPSLDADNTVFIFTPANPLKYKTEYVIEVSTEIVAQDGGLFDQDPSTPELDPFRAKFKTAGIPPKITQIIPNQGPFSGDIVVTIFGEEFTSNTDTVVKFGGYEAVAWNVLDSTQIEVIPPPGTTPGAIDVSVTNINGTAVAPSAYSYIIPISEKVGQVVINEVVASPQQDWSDSDGGNGVSFDSVPGTGSPREEDEWIELKNISDTLVNLTGWSVVMVDSQSSVQKIGTGGAVTRFSNKDSNFTSFQPGDYLVIGNPEGNMEANVYILLLDENSALVDSVELGNVPQSPPDGDGAPAGSSNGPYNESVSRFPDGQDSNPDETKSIPNANVIDFLQRTPTIGSSNGTQRTTPGIVVINEVVTDPQYNWDDSNVEGGVPFDNDPGRIRATQSDEWLELYNTSEEPVDLRSWFIVMIDSVPDVDTLISGRPDILCSGGSTLENFLPKTFCVIGNPEGTMEDNILIQLKDPAGFIVDSVEIGNDLAKNGSGNGAPGKVPPTEDPDGSAIGSYDGSSSDPTSEAIARVPNGFDCDKDEDGKPDLKEDGTPVCETPNKDDFIKRSATIMASNDNGLLNPGEVVINEVVTDPQRDWSSNANPCLPESAQIPYDSIPCESKKGVNRKDQYIELYNKTDKLVNMTGWRIDMDNGGITFTEYLGVGNILERFDLYFSNPSDREVNSLSGGAYLVVGNTQGIMQNRIQIILRDGAGTRIDSVKLAFGNEANDAPIGTSTGPGDEAVQRTPDGQDSDPEENGEPVNADNLDFTKNVGTPGEPNTTAEPGNPGEVVINEVVTDPQKKWSSTNFECGKDPGLVGTPGAEDQFIELYVKKAKLDLRKWQLEIIQYNDAGVPMPVRRGVLDSEAVNGIFAYSNYCGKGNLSNSEPDSYVVLGNPVIPIKNTALLTLYNAANVRIDSVEIGDDPEQNGGGNAAPEGLPGGGDANSVANEAVARMVNKDAQVPQDSDCNEDGNPPDADALDFVQMPVSIGTRNPVETSRNQKMCLNEKP